MSVVASVFYFEPMKRMDPLVEHLRMLEALESLNPQTDNSESEIDRVRAMLPASILGQHDYRRRRSQRSLAALVNGACGHCRSDVPRALMIQMQRGGSLGVCPECSGYLYLEEPAAREMPALVPAQEIATVAQPQKPAGIAN